MLQAVIDEGLLPEKVSVEQLRKEMKSAVSAEDSGVDYEAEYRKQTGKDLYSGDYTVQ